MSTRIMLVPSKLVAVFFLLIIVALIEGNLARGPPPSKVSDLVINLPGQPPNTNRVRHYAGYVRINKVKSMFYWFFEAMEEAMGKPLVLWLNGGPGCSSIAAGALKEIGPFLVVNDGSGLRSNPYTWIKVANILFLESPVGVGFSYSNKSSDLEKYNDKMTAEDTYSFLVNWFIKFPTFKSHEFYIAGESYGGHYVPQLALLLHKKNNRAMKNSYIDLKGLLIGNPMLDWGVNFFAMAEFGWNHGIISYKLYQTFINECQSVKDGSIPYRYQQENCADAMHTIFARINLEDIDTYNIYMPTCSKKNGPTSVAFVGLEKEQTTYDPCANFIMDIYLNRNDVQRALHTHLPYPYSTCNKHIKDIYDRNDVGSTVVPTVRKLLDVGLRVWIYSGDLDAAVPMQGTREVIISMNLTEKAWDKWGGWREWYCKDQVAGWMVEYVEGLSFITIRGAGHMVPVNAPERSLTLFSHFIKGEPLPSNDTSTKV